MADILQDFPIRAPIERVFDAVSTPAGLDVWWTERSAGAPHVGNEYQLRFGPAYDWRATVVCCDPPIAFELLLTTADEDWRNTRVGFLFAAEGDLTRVQFYHTGWPAANAHYRVSSHCWAMYLRLLRRYLEHGELVPYERRLDA